jgi:predicted transcriptional regulator
MIEKLKIKAIYDDFLENVNLTDEQKRILDMLIKRETIVKIAMEIGASQRTINYEIKKIKSLWSDYYNLQLLRVMLLIQ